jgi:hypothetical protein
MNDLPAATVLFLDLEDGHSAQATLTERCGRRLAACPEQKLLPVCCVEAGSA